MHIINKNVFINQYDSYWHQPARKCKLNKSCTTLAGVQVYTYLVRLKNAKRIEYNADRQRSRNELKYCYEYIKLQLCTIKSILKNYRIRLIYAIFKQLEIETRL